MSNSVLFIHHEKFVPNVEKELTEGCSGTAYSIGLVAQKLKSQYVDVLVLNVDELDSIENDFNNVVVVTKSIEKLDQILAKFKNAKITHWNHNFLHFDEYQKFKKSNFKSNIVAVSDYHAGWLLTKTRIWNTHRIYNPYISMANASQREVECENINTLKLVFSGSLSEQKGFDVFLSLIEVLGLSRKLEVVCCGNLDDAYLQSRVDVVNNKLSVMGGSIKLTGMLDKLSLQKVLSDSHFLLYGLNRTGAAETFGISFLDAQVNGCIPLTLNRGGQYEAISPAIRSEVVFDSLNQLERFLKNVNNKEYEVLRNKLLLNVDDFINKFNPEIVIKAWIKVLFDNPSLISRLKEYSGFVPRLLSTMITKIKSKCLLW